jgi:hypothetical protein
MLPFLDDAKDKGALTLPFWILPIISTSVPATTSPTERELAKQSMDLTNP